MQKAAKKRRKAKKKKAKKLLEKMIKKEQAKYTHFGFYEVPHNYAQIPGNNSNEKFYSVHLGKSRHFDGKDYPKWAYDMQMHLYGLHPSLWRLWLYVLQYPPKERPSQLSMSKTSTATCKQQESSRDPCVPKNSTRFGTSKLPR
jgi:hypothetical protein